MEGGGVMLGSLPRAGGRLQLLLSALRASHFLLLRQKKVSKEKATPTCAVGYADSPVLLATGGGCGTRAFGPQTVLALFPPAAALLGAPHGDPKVKTAPSTTLRHATTNRRKNSTASPRDAFRVPLRGAEQRRRAGGSRFALSEPQASSCEPPGSPSSARDRACPAPTQGSPFSCASNSLWLLSFGEAKESTPALKAENNGRKNDLTHQARKPAPRQSIKNT